MENQSSHGGASEEEESGCFDGPRLGELEVRIETLASRGRPAGIRPSLYMEQNETRRYIDSGQRWEAEQRCIYVWYPEAEPHNASKAYQLHSTKSLTAKALARKEETQDRDQRGPHRGPHLIPGSRIVPQDALVQRFLLLVCSYHSDRQEVVPLI